MTNNNEIKLGLSKSVEPKITTSFGNAEKYEESVVERIKINPELKRIFIRLFITLTIVFGLNRFSNTIRFATATSFETIVHFSLHKICSFLEISHAVADALDVVFFVTIILMATNMLLEILSETATLIKNLNPNTIQKVNVDKFTNDEGKIEN